MSARSKIVVVARVLLGLAFTVFGLNFFLHFLPQPPPPPEAGVFLGALFAGKIFSIIKPIEIGILAFHGVFEPSGLPIVVVLVALTIFLAWSYRAAFAPLLHARVEPTAAEPVAAHRTAPV